MFVANKLKQDFVTDRHVVINYKYRKFNAHYFDLFEYII